VYVRHPSFEDEDYLAPLGLKQYWTDWPETHTAKVRLAEFTAMAARHGVQTVSVQGIKRATGSDDPTILPLSAPSNQRKRPEERGEYGLYDRTEHGPKPSLAFDHAVYFAYDIFFVVSARGLAISYDDDPDDALARPVVRWDVERKRRFRRS